MSWNLLPLIPPGLLMLAAALAFARPGRRPAGVPLLVEVAAIGALVATLAAALVLGLVGALSVRLSLAETISLSVRLDTIGATMLVLVAFVGWIVLRYSTRYLDGEDRQGAFLGWLAATLAAVLVLVQAGNLPTFLAAWIVSSLCLHRLLVFYPERAAARRAARKKFIVARLSDAALALAFLVLAASCRTDDIPEILGLAARGEATVGMSIAAALIAFAALLKSAQFPTHGWLTEVMEAPTPVSALLHAGLINAGGFLLIRFADVLLTAPGVLAVLVLVGGGTALLGSLAMLTQPAVKTSLAWSTIAQMGFMIMQCGLALFSLALLHIVAHSLYKAHAFLSSGGAVERIAALRRPGPVAVPGATAILAAFSLALIIYGAISLAFGVEGKSPQALAVGAILIFGVAYLIAQGLADAAPWALTLRTGACSLLAAIGYFALQTGAEWLTAGSLPQTPAPGPLEWALIVLAMTSFGLVALAQAAFPLWVGHPAAAVLRVHIANGLYANAIFDRLIGNWIDSRPANH